MSMACTIKRYVGFVSLVFVFLLVLSTEARAELYGFEAISWNSGENTANALAEQLSLEVTDPGDDQVLFTFYNAGPLVSSITDVYFDDGALLGIAVILDESTSLDSLYSGVDFEQFANPPDLPGGNTLLPPFEVTVGFSADSEQPIVANGVEPGEALGILFDLDVDESDVPLTFADVIAAINVGFNPDTYYTGAGDYDGWIEPNLRISLRIQSYGVDNEFSDGFIMTPEPGSLLLGSIGIGMVIARCRKRKTLIES